MNRSFSSKPRRQRHFSVLKERSSISSVPTTLALVSDGAGDHHFLDLADGLGRVQTLRAHIDAVHDGVATEQAIGVFQVVQALASCLITAVDNEPVGLQQAGWAHELVRVPPETRAAGRATGAQDAFVQTVELLALF